MATQTSTTTLNGVNVDQLVETINHIKEQPDLAKFRFRAKNEWIDGALSRTTIHKFDGAGQEHRAESEPFVMEGDEPQVLLGENKAPNAVESVLHALASCISVGFIYNAAAQNINVDKLEMNLEGDIDLHAFLGLSDTRRPGYNNIRLTYTVKADAPEEKLKELCSYVQKTSPVLDIIRNPVPVSISMNKKEA
ncbi:MAG: OsmC family protein [Mariniphaga sp.]